MLIQKLFAESFASGVIYLIIRNQKDKEVVVESFNETEIVDEDDSKREKTKDN